MEMTHFSKRIVIDNVALSEADPVFLIAEAGVNHNGNLQLAIEMIDVAKTAGAHAVKFQAFDAESLILKDVKKAPYQIASSGSKNSQYEMLKSLEFTKDQFQELKEYCLKKDITLLVTPFDSPSLNMLEGLDLPAYKIASTDLTNYMFLNEVAAKDKPIILSTGMSYYDEIKQALQEISKRNKDVILLQCTAQYPAPETEVNLNVIKTFRDDLDILAGFSDHTPGIGASPCAVAAGAVLVEKHFTLDKNMPGPDHKASLNPEELTQWVREIRKVSIYMGSFSKEPENCEKETRLFLQKSLVAANTIEKGEVFTSRKITAKRTGGRGMQASLIDMLVGKTSSRSYQKDEIIKL